MVLIGEVEGSITGGKNLKLELSALNLKNQGGNSIEFNMDNVNLIANQEGIIIDQFSGTIGNAPINGMLSYLHSESKFIGSINIDAVSYTHLTLPTTPYV